MRAEEPKPAQPEALPEEPKPQPGAPPPPTVPADMLASIVEGTVKATLAAQAQNPSAVDFRPGAKPKSTGAAKCAGCGLPQGEHACKLAYTEPGKPKIVGIPRAHGEGTECHLTISSLPANVEVISNLVVFDAYTPMLDPGKYRYTLHQIMDPGPNTMIKRWHGEFLVDLSEEQYRRMLRLRAKLARGIQTTEGPRWQCGYIGCKRRFTSYVQIIQHEGEHFGRDLLHEEDEAQLAMSAEEVATAAAHHARLLAAQQAQQPAAPVQP